MVTGPNTSRLETLASRGTSARTVGVRTDPVRWPLSRTVAPAFTASSTQDSTRSAALESIIGPTPVEESIGSPHFRAAVAATNLSTTHWYTGRWTRTRCTLMHTCPA